MRRSWIYRLLVILAALVAAFAVYFSAMIMHALTSSGRLPMFQTSPIELRWLFGIPSNAASSAYVFVVNNIWWGILGALVYAAILRLGLGGPIRWKRWLTLLIITLLAGSILILSSSSMGIGPTGLLPHAYSIWFLAGLFVVRDWVVRPVHNPVTAQAGAAA